MLLQKDAKSTECQGIKLSENKILLEDMERLSRIPVDWKLLKNSTILVTGATGFIGSILIKMIAQISFKYGLNIHIVAFARDIKKFDQIFRGYEVDCIIGDARDRIEYAGSIDYIFHCAAVTHSKEIVNYPVENLLISILGTRNILDLAKEKKVKNIIYISSMEMYGTVISQAFDNRIGNTENMNSISDGKVTENMLGYIDLTNPRSSYPEGKRASECLCNAYFAEYGLPVKIARLAQTFGAGVSQEENRVFAQFAKSAVDKSDIILHTDGSSEGNYCYISDAISGLIFILLKGQNGETYNIANEALHMTIKQMAEFVAEVIAEGRIKVVLDIPEDMNRYGYPPTVKLHLSSEKLSRLGWIPEYSMKDMYERMVRYWKEEEQDND